MSMNTRIAKIITVSVMAAVLFVMTHGTTHAVKNTPAPGYRPCPGQSGLDQAFVDALKESSITVYPSVFRSNLFPSSSEQVPQKALADCFTNIPTKRVEVSDTSINLMDANSNGPGQKGVFDTGLTQLAEQIKAIQPTTDYICVAEYLHTATRSGGQAIGGIQCYILNAQGENVFSFLLNSHHDLFNQAELRASTPDIDEKIALLDRASSITCQALLSQIKGLSKD